MENKNNKLVSFADISDMWKLLTLWLTHFFLVLADEKRNVIVEDTMQHPSSGRIDFYFLEDENAFLWAQQQSDRCPWLPACICRDESKYTNGTYKLMVNCTEAGLKTVPKYIPSNTTVLTLDRNNITELQPGAFKNLTILKYLDLSNNNIDILKNGIFNGLRNLHTLELSGNKIRYDRRSIHNNVFKPLVNLQRLNLHQNLDKIFPEEEYPKKALTELRHLKQLLIDGIETKEFSQTFKIMSGLRTVELSSDIGRCNLSKINADMFTNLSGITELKLSNCNIEQVEFRGFSELKNLTSLDLSGNEHLHFKSLSNITSGLQNLTMRDLRLQKIHETFGDCTRLEREHLQYLQGMRIDNIYLDANRLAYIAEDAVDFIPRKIQKLSLTNNILLAGEYLHKVFDGPVFENLKYLTLAEQNMNYDALKFFSNKTKSMLRELGTKRAAQKPVSGNINDQNLYIVGNESENYNRSINASIFMEPNRSCSNCHGNGLNYDIILYFPRYLKSLDFSGLRIRNELKNICICQPNSLIRLNLERNIFWNWQGPIVGLSSLLNLNLAWNSCDNMSLDVFDHLADLIQLNLTRNFIERFLRKDTEGRIFQKLTNLQQLLLGDNKIRYLPEKIFSGLKALRGIDLSNNFLTQFDVIFDHRVPLQTLNLNFNLLGKLGKKVMDKFDDVKHSKPLFQTYYIELLGNKLSCTCRDIDFVKWVSRTTVRFIDLENYTCAYEKGGQRNLISAADIYRQLQKDCAKYTVLIMSASLGFVFFLSVVIFGLIYRYRWDLRYFYYSIKLRMKGHVPLINHEDDDAEFTHDAFVSYANENGTFVKESVVPELEETRQMRLLVHDRDFRAGDYVCDNIMEAITTSRKTLILMSKDFIKSDWCVFEMNMARMEAIKTGRNVVCLLMLDEVPTSGLPLEIIDIIRQQTYLEVPTDSAHKELFWDRVQDALKQ